MIESDDELLSSLTSKQLVTLVAQWGGPHDAGRRMYLDRLRDDDREASTGLLRAKVLRQIDKRIPLLVGLSRRGESLLPAARELVKALEASDNENVAHGPQCARRLACDFRSSWSRVAGTVRPCEVHGFDRCPECTCARRYPRPVPPRSA